MNITSNNTLWQRAVDFIPMDQFFTEIKDHNEYPEKTAIFSDDRTKLFGVFSSSCLFIKHEDLLQQVTDSIVSMFNTEPEITVNAIKEGGRIRATFYCDAFPQIDIGDGDICSIQIIVDNNYYNPSNFNIGIGAYRFVCSNGMKIGKTIGGFSAKNFKDEGFNQETIPFKIEKLLNEAKRLEDIWKFWKSTWLKPKEILDRIATKFPEKLIETITLNMEPNENGDVNLWDVYNIFTNYSTHETKTSGGQILLDDKIANIFYGIKSPLRELDSSAFEKLDPETLDETENTETLEDE